MNQSRQDWGGDRIISDEGTGMSKDLCLEGQYIMLEKLKDDSLTKQELC